MFNIIKITTKETTTCDGLPKFVLRRGRKIEAKIYQVSKNKWYLENVFILSFKTKDEAFNKFKKDFIAWAIFSEIKENQVRFNF
jgi:hypothetical protein